jgi:hypothetical protein
MSNYPSIHDAYGGFGEKSEQPAFNNKIASRQELV